MAEFTIDSEIFLGYHCNGCGEYTCGDGSVKLDDSQVESLVALIRENDGKTDVTELGLEEKFPDIYEALDEACGNVARKAEYRYWLLNGYDCGYYEEPEGFMEGFEEKGLFKFEPDLEALREDLCLEEDEEIDDDDLEDAKREAFDEWLEGYVDAMTEDEKVAFIEEHYGSDVVDMDGAGCDYEVVIPQGIIDLAQKD